MPPKRGIQSGWRGSQFAEQSYFVVLVTEVLVMLVTVMLPAAVMLSTLMLALSVVLMGSAVWSTKMLLVSVALLATGLLEASF